jgi:hypothetical protein
MKEVLKLALEALEEAHYKIEHKQNAAKREQAITAIREALAQPEQEPVAWGVFEGNLHDMFFTQEEAQEMADLKGTHAEVRPFYTNPPAAQPMEKPMHPQIQKMYEDYFDKCFRESSALDAAVLAEREACAKVCESYLSESPHSWGGTTMSAAIRARGNT